MAAIVEVMTPCSEALAGRDAFDFEAMVPIDTAYSKTAKIWNTEGFSECRTTLKEIQRYICDGASVFIFMLLSFIAGTFLSLAFGLFSGAPATTAPYAPDMTI